MRRRKNNDSRTQGRTASPVAKIAPPRPGRSVARTRLFDILDDARDRPLTWISAPPGAGKTTLATSYVAARRYTCLWYQVDTGDRDVATFFHYFSVAVRRTAPARRKPLPVFSSDYAAGLDRFARRYFEDAFERIRSPAIIVLDNYQEAGADAQLDRVLLEAAAAAHEGVRFLILSRTDPPPAFARLRANNALALVGPGEMSLTQEEARSIVSLHGAAGAAQGSHASADELNRIAQGWTAGLVLLLEHERSPANAPPGAASSPGTVLFDYFAEEVFRHADAPTQRILLQTAVLPRVTARMADELTGTGNAEPVLERLYRGNFFVAKHDQAQAAYQYHPLFRGFLLRLGNAMQPAGERAALRERAAQLLERDGQFEEAVAMLTEDAQWSPLARLVLAQADRTLRQGRGRTLIAWIEALPGELRGADPWLQYWHGLACIAFDPAKARASLESASAGFRANADSKGIYLAWSGVVESIMYDYARLQELDRWIAIHDELRAQGVAYPTPEIEARAATSMLIAIAVRQQSHREAELWVSSAIELADTHGDALMRAQARGAAVMLRIWTGNYTKAGIMLAQLKRQAEREPPPPYIQISVCMIEAIYVGNTLGRFADYESVERGLRISEETGIHNWDGELNGQGAVMALSCGELRAADAFLARMGVLSHASRSVHVAGYHLFMAWALHLRGDIAAALTHAETAMERAVESGSRAVEVHSRISHAELLHAHGRSAEALQRLAYFDRFRSRRGSFRRWLVTAGIELDSGNEQRALECLRDSLAVGREEGYVNFYGWRPELMSRLCAKALEAGIEPDYVRRLIRTRGIPPLAAARDSQRWPWPVKLRVLGEFTLEVDDKPVRFAAKAQRKPLELLKALVAFGARAVPEAKVAQALWPDAEGDAAQQALATTLHRLRKLLGNEAAIDVEAGALSLQPDCAWTDALVFERIADRAEASWSAGAESAKRDSEAALSLYHGPFLAAEEAPWALGARERLRAKFLRLSRLLADRCEASSDWPGAIRVYERALESDNLVEDLYRRLMRCHIAAGQRAEALVTYRRCRNLLSVVLGLQPAAETQALYRQIGGG